MKNEQFPTEKLPALYTIYLRTVCLTGLHFEEKFIFSSIAYGGALQYLTEDRYVFRKVFLSFIIFSRVFLWIEWVVVEMEDVTCLLKYSKASLFRFSRLVCLYANLSYVRSFAMRAELLLTFHFFRQKLLWDSLWVRISW